MSQMHAVLLNERPKLALDPSPCWGGGSNTGQFRSKSAQNRPNSDRSWFTPGHSGPMSAEFASNSAVFIPTFAEIDSNWSDAKPKFGRCWSNSEPNRSNSAQHGFSWHIPGKSGKFRQHARTLLGASGEVVALYRMSERGSVQGWPEF